MSLLRDLQRAASPLPLSSRFIIWNGVAYGAVGALFVVWPGAVQALSLGPPFVGQEAGLIRVIGLTLAIIGWFYIFGGRTGGRQVVAASVVDRVVLVPLVLIPLAWSGVFPLVLGTFAVVDPVLGLCAWALLARDAPDRRDG